MTWVIVLLVLILLQLCFLGLNIGEARKAAIAASDLNLEAHARLLAQLEAIERQLDDMPKAAASWES